MIPFLVPFSSSSSSAYPLQSYSSPPPPPSPNAQEGEREGGGRGGRGGKKTITAVQRERCVISDYSSLSVTVIRRES